MFVSLVVPLTALNSIEPPTFYGREAHALLLDLVTRADAELAASLHSEQQRKPFTVSSLRGAERVTAGRISIAQGRTYSLRFTSVGERLSAVLLETIAPNLPPTIRLGNAQFETGKAICDASADAWSGQTSADALMAKWFGADARIADHLALEFASPTAFKRQGRSFVLPEPALAFQSYLAAWNEFAFPAFDPALLAKIENEMVITRYQLRTEALQLRNQGDAAPSQIGFAGRCGFTIFNPERALWRTLHLLADFAFFCGTGYKTTQGMGQTRRVSGQ